MTRHNVFGDVLELHEPLILHHLGRSARSKTNFTKHLSRREKVSCNIFIFLAFFYAILRGIIPIIYCLWIRLRDSFQRKNIVLNVILCWIRRFVLLLVYAHRFSASVRPRVCCTSAQKQTITSAANRQTTVPAEIDTLSDLRFYLRSDHGRVSPWSRTLPYEASYRT